MKDGRVAVIRTLKKEDLPSLVRFVNSLVREKRLNRTLGVALDRLATSKSEAKFLNGRLDEIRSGKTISVAAEVNGEVVGNSAIVRRTSSREMRHTGALGIAVLSPYRGAGLGEEMMKTLLKEARRVGIELVELEVFSVNTGARRLYRRLGFREVGVIPRKMRRGRRYFDIVAMYTDLRSDKSTNRSGPSR
jgi:RimJ/RimL family protein N-acetyltransferase